MLWGIGADGPLAAVRRALERSEVPFAFIDQHALVDSAMTLTCDGTAGGTLRSPNGDVRLDEVTAAFLRPYDPRRILREQGLDAGSCTWQVALEYEDLLSCWSEITTALVVNRPSAMASNNSKPYQTRLVEQHGFAVPETLLTTDVDAVADFRSRHQVIYKSMSGIRSIVSRIRDDDVVRLGDIANCPTQFQRYVQGTDVRVHVIGDEIFACEVRSDADDYRYPQEPSNIADVTTLALPNDIRERCGRLATALRLPLAGIDLRRTQQGEWYCFEVNPSPGFTFFEDATGQPIADAVGRLLASPARESATRNAVDETPTVCDTQLTRRDDLS